jgi:hypothetical protein
MADEERSGKDQAQEADERLEDLDIPDETAEQVKGGQPGWKVPKKQSDKF